MPFMKSEPAGKGRSVRFNDEITFFASYAKPCISTSSSQKRADLEILKQESVTAGRVIQLEHRKKGNPLTYCSVHTRIYETCLTENEPSDADVEHLACWIDSHPERRGLERYMLITQSCARGERVTMHRVAILRLQASTRLHRMTAKDTEALLARTSSQMTKPEAFHARAVAKADAMALKRSPRQEQQELLVTVVTVSVTKAKQRPLPLPSSAIEGVSNPTMPSSFVPPLKNKNTNRWMFFSSSYTTKAERSA